MRDIKSNVDAINSILPQSLTAAANGTGVDLQNCDEAMVVFHAGALGGTATPTFTFAVQESDDDSTYNDAAAADLQGAAPVVTTTNAGITEVGYIGAKRYIRAIVKTVSGTSPTLLASAAVVKGALKLRGTV